MKRCSVTCEDPDNKAVIDNIGSFPFFLEASWENGWLYIKVTQPRCGHPYPLHEFEVPLLDKPEESSKE